LRNAREARVGSRSWPQATKRLTTDIVEFLKSGGGGYTASEILGIGRKAGVEGGARGRRLVSLKVPRAKGVGR